MPVTFQVEPYSEMCEEWLDGPISKEHWQEIAMDKDEIELAVSRETYKDMETKGILHCLTVRDEGKLVGYYIAIVMVHPHYSTFGPMAMTDIYYLAPEYRCGTTAFQMMQEVEDTLRLRGVKKIYTSCKVHKDLSPFFLKLGWRPTDVCFTKLV